MRFLSKLWKKEGLADLSKLKVDVHSHLIPGIDDGAATLDHSIGMIMAFADLGYQRLVTTPHVMLEGYVNTPEIILSGLGKVRQAIQELKIPIEIDAAAEYYFDAGLIEKIENKKLLTFGGNHVLFEFSFHQEPHFIDELIFAFKTHGYLPVLAHFERYGYYNSLEKAKELREKGVKIQLNLNSLSGHYGPQVQKQAEQMVKQKIVDLAGSDCHRIEHLQILKKNLSKPMYHQLLDLDLLNYQL